MCSTSFFFLSSFLSSIANLWLFRIGINSLVGANTGSLQSLRTQLFVLIGDHVNAEREIVDIGLLSSEIEDSDLWVGDTTVESGLRIWL